MASNPGMFVASDDSSTPVRPSTWVEGSYAVKWGRWEWGPNVLEAAQRWGDAHGCRFLVTSEQYNDGDEYMTYLYVAPKPNSLRTGLCDHSLSNRDKGIVQFGAWLEGYVAGLGLIKPGDRVGR